MKTPRKERMSIVQRIRFHYDGLSETYKKIAAFILNNLETATFVSLEEISTRVGLSDATLIRFARELGYSGYQELREDLVDYISRIIYPAHKLTLSIKQKEIPTLEIVKNTDIQYINQTMDNLDREWFEKLVEFIISAKRIFCVGWGISSFLAEFLSFQLSRLSFDARAVTRERRPLVEQVLFLRGGDILIVFDLLMYSSEVVEAVEYLHRNHDEVKIVTFTNDSSAHIVQYADLSFFCDTIGPSKSTLISLTAPMCLINAILEEVIVKKARKAERALTEFQKEVLSNTRYYFQFNSKKLEWKMVRKNGNL